MYFIEIKKKSIINYNPELSFGCSLLFSLIKLEIILAFVNASGTIYIWKSETSDAVCIVITQKLRRLDNTQVVRAFTSWTLSIEHSDKCLLRNDTSSSQIILLVVII